MFRVIVNGFLIGSRKTFGGARDLASLAKNNYTKQPIITIEDQIGRVIEIVKWDLKWQKQITIYCVLF